MKRALAFAVYLLAGLAGGFLTVQQIGAAVWGAPVSPLTSVALLADLALVAGAIAGLWAPAAGRNIATAALALLGLLYLPALGEIVPGPGEAVDPLGGIFLLGFFAVAAFALLFPSRRKHAGRIAAVAVGVGVIAFGFTYLQHWRLGEFNRPTIEGFYLRGEGALQVRSDPHARLTPPVLGSLRAAGLGGELYYSGGEFHASDASVMLVILRQPPAEEKKLYLPRGNSVIYEYDGKTWTTLPSSSAVYPTFVTLTTDGMIREQSGNAFGIFRWRR